MKTLNDRVVIRRIEPEVITKSGIVIPESVTDKPNQGVVIAVGKGKKDKFGNRIPLEVKVDDQVLFNKNTGTVIRYNGENLLIIKEDDIFAVLES